MRILGIDPGSRRTGYGCVERHGSRHTLVVCGILAGPAKAAFPDKLKIIHAGLAALHYNQTVMRAIRIRHAALAGEPPGEAIRAWGAVKMGLLREVAEAATRQHTPKIAFVAPPQDYLASSGKPVQAADVDLLVRALSMGQLHHAMMGTAAVAIGVAAAVPGTLVNLAAGGGERSSVRFGHPSGTLRVGAEALQVGGQWTVTKAIMSRSARVLMEGFVRVPGDCF